MSGYADNYPPYHPSEMILRLGRNVRNARVLQGMTGQQLADRVGISISGLSRIERGNRSTSIWTYEGLAEELGVSLGWLIDHQPTHVEQAAADSAAEEIADRGRGRR